MSFIQLLGEKPTFELVIEIETNLLRVVGYTEAAHHQVRGERPEKGVSFDRRKARDANQG
jgi:hypothetical protein